MKLLNQHSRENELDLIKIPKEAIYLHIMVYQFECSYHKNVFQNILRSQLKCLSVASSNKS